MPLALAENLAREVDPMRESSLPPVFAQYQALVQYVQKVGHAKWTSNCPACLGSVHSDGELPNRCVWFFDDKPLGYCFQCGKTFWPDKTPDWEPPTAEELAGWQREREQEQEARLRSAQTALANLRSTELWVQYNSMMSERERQWWRSRGIPDSFQNVWGFGWCHDRNAASIPLFGPDYNLLNIKYRLMDESKGKYRPHLAGLPAVMWLADPDVSMENHIVACEGEVKAAVSYVTLDDPKACIVGLPGLNPSQSIIDTLAQADRVTLILDPDSDTPGDNGWSAAGKLVKAVGRDKTRLLVPPAKVDDGLLASRSDRWDMRRLLRQAVEM